MNSLRRHARAILGTFLLLMMGGAGTHAGSPGKNKAQGSLQANTVGVYHPLLIGNVFNYYGNNGDGSFNLYTSDKEGYEFPKGSDKHTIFEDGLVWGGYHKGSANPKVGGSTYGHGLQPGPLLSYGTLTTDPLPADPSDQSYRVYRVRPDINPHVSPTIAVAQIQTDEIPYLSRYEGLSARLIYDQYMQDWNQWPASLGAPFTYGKDTAGIQRTSGPYDPRYDIPGKPGADQTLWYVANDMNPALTASLSGSLPVGLEMRRTIWGYRSAGAFGNTVFQSTVLVNKSGAQIDSMFIAQWSDPDLGYAGDDYVGCDTTRSLGYVYNGASVDPVYGTAVPAVGFTILQGPKTPSPGDSAIFFGRRLNGFRNLPMSAFVMFVNGSTIYKDPALGSGGEIGWYNLMRGTISSSGAPFIDPNTSKPTKFVFPGDPVTGTGWTASQTIPPSDVRMALVTGPFTMAAGDTQEIVFANLVALGSDRLSSVTALESGTTRDRAVWNGGVFAAISPVDSVYAVNDTIRLYGSANTFVPASTSLQWLLVSKPSGSAAELSSETSAHTVLRVDLPGNYRVSLAVSGGGIFDTASVDLSVSAVQRPVPAFTLPVSVTLGDTVTIDGSGSVDPNGRPLSYVWSVEGSLGTDRFTPRDTLPGYLSSQTGAVVKFVPFRTSLHTVTLNVNNGVFTIPLAKTFQVKPFASPNIQLRAEYPSGALPSLHAEGFGATSYYGWGSIKELDGTIWVNDAGTCAQANFQNFGQPAQVYNMVGFPFDGGQNYIAASNTAEVFVVKTDGHGHVVNQGTFFPFPNFVADSAVQGVVFVNPYILLPCSDAGILVYDVTSPASPVKKLQYTNGQNWSSVTVRGNQLFGVHPATNTVSVVDISNPTSIAPVISIPLGRSYGSITNLGNYFYLIKANTSTSSLIVNRDTIAIYDFSTLSSPVLKGVIGVPRTFNPFNRFNNISGNGNTIIASTAEGLYVFDVTNPSAPSMVGEFLTGSNHGNVFMNATHMLTINLNRVGPAAYAYEGLLEIESPFTGIEPGGTPGLPVSMELDQNYPNPFNPATTIRFALPRKSSVSLVVYNTLGQEVVTLIRAEEQAGYHTVRFDGGNLASGVYFYRLQAGSFVQTKKLVILK